MHFFSDLETIVAEKFLSHLKGTRSQLNKSNNNNNNIINNNSSNNSNNNNNNSSRCQSAKERGRENNTCITNQERPQTGHVRHHPPPDDQPVVNRSGLFSVVNDPVYPRSSHQPVRVPDFNRPYPQRSSWIAPTPVKKRSRTGLRPATAGSVKSRSRSLKRSDTCPPGGRVASGGRPSSGVKSSTKRSASCSPVRTATPSRRATEVRPCTASGASRGGVVDPELGAKPPHSSARPKTGKSSRGSLPPRPHTAAKTKTESGTKPGGGGVSQRSCFCAPRAPQTPKKSVSIVEDETRTKGSPACSDRSSVRSVRNGSVPARGGSSRGSYRVPRSAVGIPRNPCVPRIAARGIPKGTGLAKPEKTIGFSSNMRGADLRDGTGPECGAGGPRDFRGDGLVCSPMRPGTGLYCEGSPMGSAPSPVPQTGYAYFYAAYPFSCSLSKRWRP